MHFALRLPSCCTLVVLSLVLLAPCTARTAQPEPLPYPADVATEPLAIAQLLDSSGKLNTWIGGYPPKIRDERQRQEIYAEWKRLLASARAVQARDGDTAQALLLLGRLYRQGHNLDVRQCGEKAVALFEQALVRFPDSEPLLREASYLYLSINPKFAPKGEAVLQRLRKLRGTDRDLEIERGFIFAYLYQNRLAEAKKQIAHCLELAPDDKMLLQLQNGLKNQQTLEVKNGPPPTGQ